MKKQRIVLGALSLPLLVLVSSSVSAKSINLSLGAKGTVPQIVRKQQQNEDLENQATKECRQLASALSNNKMFANELDPAYGIIEDNTPVVYSNKPFASVNDDMVIKDAEAISAHVAYLDNVLDEDSPMATASFKYSHEDSVTTTTTNAVGTEVTTSAEMKFPFVSGSMSMSVKYDFSTTNEVKSTDTKEWEVPSQTVTVPAHHKYKVEWILKKGKATGTTALTNEVKADIPYESNLQGQNKYFPIGKAIKEQERLWAKNYNEPIFQRWENAENWDVIDDSKALRHWSEATYEAEFGTELDVKYSDVTTGQTVLIKQMATKVAPKTIK